MAAAEWAWIREGKPGGDARCMENMTTWDLFPAFGRLEAFHAHRTAVNLRRHYRRPLDYLYGTSIWFLHVRNSPREFSDHRHVQDLVEVELISVDWPAEFFSAGVGFWELIKSLSGHGYRRGRRTEENNPSLLVDEL